MAEVILSGGLLSRATSYRIIVTGPIGSKEISRLIAQISVIHEIFNEPAPAPTDTLRLTELDALRGPLANEFASGGTIRTEPAVNKTP